MTDDLHAAEMARTGQECLKQQTLCFQIRTFYSLLMLAWLCRDLKPENVLLATNGDVKLSDFGLGYLPTLALHNDVLQTTCGTPNYVAPEVLMRKGYYGAPAEIWSLGKSLMRICHDLFHLFYIVSQRIAAAFNVIGFWALFQLC